MNKSTIALTAFITALWGSSVMAETSCIGPIQDGNTWSLICSDQGAGDADQDAVYQCNYSLTVTNADGQTDTVNASGSVEQGQQDVVIWSGVESGGSAITSATVDSGSCSTN
jgi:hypothetical protein